MTSPDSEAALVELPACDLLAGMGWAVLDASQETFGAAGTLGRTDVREAVLVPRLRSALVRLNPGLPAEGIAAAIEALTRDRSGLALVAANREVYALVKDGVPVVVPDPRGGRQTVRAVVVDWRQPAANDFLAVRQLTVQGPLYTCRPDIVGFVNGLPWVLIECKAPAVAVRRGFDENLSSYKHPLNGIPRLCAHNALLIATNGTDGRIGSLTADWDRFAQWKRIASEHEPRRVSLEVLLRGVCDPVRLLDLIEHFTVFTDLPQAGTVKVIGQNHQVLGVNAAVAALRDKPADDPRLGVFWHTQGSGKSYSMLFFAQKVLRLLPGSWTFVVLTDRTELDDQIAKSFARSGALGEEDATTCRASSAANLRELLTGNHRYVFTLIHKFRTDPGTIHPRLSERRDIIVLADEAHRSQYDTLALNLRSALPNARFLAFTGTPLIAGEEATRQVFGDYVSRYDFQQSVEDNATKPLFYENRTPELKITNPNLDADLLAAVEGASLDEDDERALAKALGRNYEVLTRQTRLKTIATDIVRHFLGRGFQGKAMVVCLDKATALRMHDLVRAAWQAEQQRVEGELAKGLVLEVSEQQRLQERLVILRSTDMALVVSPGQNEIEQMRTLGERLGVPLDIVPHRTRMQAENLEERFKDSKDPLRLVFVCAMWLTGFDAPSCSTVYLDKPMANHTLMQTIARANRVWGEDKTCGLIVDYANVFTALEKALAIYGAGPGGERPVADKAKLVADLHAAIAEAVAYGTRHGVDVPALAASTGLARLTALAEAIERLIAPDAVRLGFLGTVRVVDNLYKAVLPDLRAEPAAPIHAALTSIAAVITERTRTETDIGVVLARIQKILDEGVETGPIDEVSKNKVDLSRIDFGRLKDKFKDSAHQQTDLETLKAAVAARLARMLRVNRTRTDLLERFETAIAKYNNGSQTIDAVFADLLALCRDMDAEEQRHVREHLSEDDLVVFDLLTRPDPVLTAEERDTVKQVVRQLHDRLRALLAPGWRERVTARAAVQETVESLLDAQLPRAYTPEVYKTKAARVFQHLIDQAGMGQAAG
jgi:type I restriction enzyme R subunit